MSSPAAFVHASPAAGPKNDLLNGCLAFTVNALRAASKAQCAAAGATLAVCPLPGPSSTSALRTPPFAAPPSSIPGARLAHGMLHRAATFIRIACGSDMAPSMHGSVPIFPLCDCPVLPQLPSQPAAHRPASPVQRLGQLRTPPRAAGRRRGSHSQAAPVPGHQAAAVIRTAAVIADASPVLAVVVETFVKSAEECTGSARDASEPGAPPRAASPSYRGLPAPCIKTETMVSCKL